MLTHTLIHKEWEDIKYTLCADITLKIVRNVETEDLFLNGVLSTQKLPIFKMMIFITFHDELQYY